MLIASLVAHKTKGDDKSPNPVLMLYNFEDKEDPADHQAPLELSPVPAPNSLPKKKRRPGGRH